MSVLAEPPASALADVLAILGRSGLLSPPLRDMVGLNRAARGPARTVLLEAVEPGHGRSFDELYALLDGQLRGEVLVLAGAEAVVGAVWGQILSRAARRAGATAAVVAGAVRDRAELPTEDLPVWALAEHTVGATGNAQVVAVDEAVAVAGVSVEVGDEIVSDDSGVVRLRQDEAEEILALGREYADAERLLLRDLQAGVPLTLAYDHKRRVVERLREA